MRFPPLIVVVRNACWFLDSMRNGEVLAEEKFLTRCFSCNKAKFYASSQTLVVRFSHEIQPDYPSHNIVSHHIRDDPTAYCRNVRIPNGPVWFLPASLTTGFITRPTVIVVSLLLLYCHAKPKTSRFRYIFPFPFSRSTSIGRRRIFSLARLFPLRIQYPSVGYKDASDAVIVSGVLTLV